MGTNNIYDCCNNSNYNAANSCNCTCTCEEPACEYRDPRRRLIKALDDELCNMKVDLAEIKANLVFLAQSLCNSSCLCETEEVLLLALDAEVKALRERLSTAMEQVDQLECLTSN